jgi:hypothetical protein
MLKNNIYNIDREFDYATIGYCIKVPCEDSKRRDLISRMMLCLIMAVLMIILTT